MGLDYRIAYDDIYAELSESTNYVRRGSNWYGAVRRFETISKEILNLKPNTVVDIGCGDGVYAIFLSQIGVGYVGCDIALVNLKRTKKWVKSKHLEELVSLILCDVGHLPFKSLSLENVLCSEVLEHLIDFRQALAELARVVNGNLIVSTPCVGSLVADELIINKWARQATEEIQKKISKSVYKGLVGMIEAGGAAHINIFTRGELKKQLSERGLVIKKVRGCGFNFPLFRNSDRYKFPKLARVMGILEDLLLGKLPIFFLPYIIYMGNDTIIITCESRLH